MKDLERCDKCKHQAPAKSNQNWMVCTNKNVFPLLWKTESANDCEGFEDKD